MIAFRVPLDEVFDLVDGEGEVLSFSAATGMDVGELPELNQVSNNRRGYRQDLGYFWYGKEAADGFVLHARHERDLNVFALPSLVGIERFSEPGVISRRFWDVLFRHIHHHKHIRNKSAKSRSMTHSYGGRAGCALAVGSRG